MKNNRYRIYPKPAIGLMAIGLISAGNKRALSRMQAVGAAILGFCLVWVGIDSIRTRYFDIGVLYSRTGNFATVEISSKKTYFLNV